MKSLLRKMRNWKKDDFDSLRETLGQVYDKIGIDITSKEIDKMINLEWLGLSVEVENGSNEICDVLEQLIDENNHVIVCDTTNENWQRKFVENWLKQWFDIPRELEEYFNYDEYYDMMLSSTDAYIEFEKDRCIIRIESCG